MLLRADMDALPLTEQTGLDFAAPSGRMHACGHDLHAAMLVGAARLLASQRDELAGDVVFMFQPGEEGYDGAQHMIDEGLLDAAGSPLLAAYGLHVVSAKLPHGVFATRPGPLLAGVDVLRVTVRGQGGHASLPHLARIQSPRHARWCWPYKLWSHAGSMCLTRWFSPLASSKPEPGRVSCQAQRISRHLFAHFLPSRVPVSARSRYGYVKASLPHTDWTRRWRHGRFAPLP